MIHEEKEHMRFEKEEHKELLIELGYNPNHDYVTEAELTALFIDVSDHFQKKGFNYIGTEPVPTKIGLICEEVADIIAECKDE